MNTTVSPTPTNGGATRAPAAVPPLANIRQGTDGAYVLEVEMPGVAKDGVGVSVEGNELTVTGTRSYPNISGDLLHREIRRGDYRRTFELDASIDTTRISARITNGVLRVELPVAEAVKPRRIQVEA